MYLFRSLLCICVLATTACANTDPNHPAKLKRQAEWKARSKCRPVDNFSMRTGGSFEFICQTNEPIEGQEEAPADQDRQ